MTDSTETKKFVKKQSYSSNNSDKTKFRNDKNSTNKFNSNSNAKGRSGNRASRLNRVKSRSRAIKSRNKNLRKSKHNDQNDFQSKVIQVRRVTRVVKGGKRMRFSALVVVGDGKGNVGYGIKKGLDFQDSVSKATTKAKQNIIKIKVNEAGSLDFPSRTKYKSSIVYFKPARGGTGLIAGGYIRPVLELAGVTNLYTKIIRSRNKISGTQAVLEGLKLYQEKDFTKKPTSKLKAETK